MPEGMSFTNQQVNEGIPYRTIIGIIGEALYLATTLGGTYSTVLMTPETSGTVVFSLMRGITALCFAVFLLVMVQFVHQREQLVRSRAAKVCFFALQMLLPVACFINFYGNVSLPLPLMGILWGAWGIASGFFACSWADALSFEDEERISQVYYSAYFVGIVMLVIILLLPHGTSTIALLASSAGSLVALLRSRKGATAIEGPPIPEKEIRRLTRFSARGSFIMVIDGILITNVACFVLAKVIRIAVPDIIMGIAIGIALLLLFLIRRYTPQYLSLAASQLVFLPVIVLGLLLMVFWVGVPQLVAGTALFSILFIFDVMNSLSLNTRGSLTSPSPCYCYAKGRTFIMIGQSIGWFIGAFLTSTPVRNLPLFFTIMISLLCLYFAAAASSSIRHFKNEAVANASQMTDHALLNLDKKSFTAKQVANATEGSTASTCDATPGDTIETVEKKAEPHGRPFKDKCSLAATSYALTPRESEILFFLAKGRNAKHIAEKLYVSERTVKTHTYHIYQKMGIHSQQELINIIENEDIPSSLSQDS